MVVLKDEHYMAEGLARKCYFHPKSDNLCIKIGKPGVDEAHLYKEIKYYKKIKNKDFSEFDYPFFAAYHGRIETNLGEGFVYDLVRDQTTNTVSKTLRHYMIMKDPLFSDDVLDQALLRLQSQMIKHKVFASDFKPRNICCKLLKDNSIEMVIVDGIGHRDIFPFADWFGYFAKRKVERRLIKNDMQSMAHHRQMWLANG
ncbi:YrbL family protein [Psychroserpens sp.]|uniref:YrbL family protein n=1 Tax=Psychroserpens sp. TaxID=2020870 RepID=UPI002B2693B8|nr:YrbL family protein [Psychroserpens sp.]